MKTVLLTIPLILLVLGFAAPEVFAVGRLYEPEFDDTGDIANSCTDSAKIANWILGAFSWAVVMGLYNASKSK